MNLAYDLFLLTFNLSQLHEREKIIQLFIEGVDEIFKPLKFSYSAENNRKDTASFEIKTAKSCFGSISSTIIKTDNFEHTVLINNSVQMLAIILEHLEFEQKLEKERDAFEEISISKLMEVEINLQELKESRSASINLIEDLTNEIEKRKIAEAAIRESEVKFRNLFEHSPVGKSMTGIDGTLHVNRTFCKMLGYSENELSSINWKEISHPDDIPMTDTIVKSLLSGKSDSALFEKRYIHKNGRTIYTEVSTYLQRDNEEKPQFFITTVNDITERKKYEAESFRLQDIINSSLNEIYILDSSTLLFEHLNNGALKNIGFTLEEMKQMTPMDIKPDYTEADFRKMVKPLLSGEKEILIFETIHKRKNGTVYPVEVHLQFYNKYKAGLFLAIINDISERKEALEKIELNYALLKEAGKIAKFGGWNVILSENRSYWSDEVAAIHEMPAGYSPLLSEGIAFYTPEYRDKITEVFTTCAKKGIPYDEEMQILTSTGKRVWVRTIGEAVRDHTGSIVKVQGFFQDISEQKEAQMEIIKRESFLNKVFDVLPIGLWFADTKGKLIKGNPAGIEIWGAEPTVPIEDYGLFKARRLPSGIELSGTDWALAHTITEGVTISDELLEIDAFDGKKKVILNYTAPVLNNNGNLLGAIVVNNDITDRVRAYEEIQKLNDELEKRVMERTSQLLAANKELEAFSYSVSHDLRAPLRAIHSYTAILKEDYKDILDSEGKRICGIIERSSVHMGRLIDDLLAFSRVSRTEIRHSRIDMMKMVGNVADEMLNVEEKNKIKFNLMKLPAAFGDSAAIRQVMINLISNAIKYSSKNESPEITVGCEIINNTQVFFVKDNGVGFNMQYEDKLFRVFQRLHSTKDFDGNGVGLAIVHRIISKHEGKVWAEGEVGKGATFYFTLQKNKGLRTRDISL